MPHHLHLARLGEPTRFETLGTALTEWRVQLSQPPYSVHDGRDSYFDAALEHYDRGLLIDLLDTGQAWLAVLDRPSGVMPAWWEFARAEVNYWLLYRAFQNCEDRERCKAIWEAMCAERRIQRAACELELARESET